MNIQNQLNMIQNFDSKLAIELGELVQLAYKRFEDENVDLQDELKNLKNTDKISKNFRNKSELYARPKSIAEKEFFGFIAQDGNDYYVVFRGTQTFEDWMANLTFEQVSHDGGWGKVEHGFQSIYQQCEATIKETLLLDSGGNKRIYITGHSLGGSLATLCAANLKSAQFSMGWNIELYAFASPRVGDKDFATQFNSNFKNNNENDSKAFRIVNVEDIVNTLPIATPLIKALHIPHLISGAIDELENLLNINNGMPKDLLSFFSDFNYQHVGCAIDFSEQNGDIIENHKMETYLNSLLP